MNLGRLRQRIGAGGERRALQYLSKQGLKPIQQNYRCRFGEVDLIMLHHQTLVFVEVKTRGQQSWAPGSFAVNARKQERLRKTAQHFLAENGRYQQLAARFDVVSIDGTELNWIRQAF